MERKFAEFLEPMEEFEFEGSLECLFKQLDDSKLDLIPGLVESEKRRRLKRASTASIDSDAKKSRPSSLSTSEPNLEDDSLFEDSSKICDVSPNGNTGPGGNSPSSPGRLSTSSVLSNQQPQDSPSTPARNAASNAQEESASTIGSGPQNSPNNDSGPEENSNAPRPMDNYMSFGFASGRKPNLTAAHALRAAALLKGA